jgi:ABC-2 type transport system permease protein
MSESTPAWRVITEREMSVRIRDKVFVGSTLFLLTLVVAAILLSSVLSGRPETYELGVVDETGQTIGAAAQERLRAQTGNDDVVEARTFDGPEAVEQAVLDGEVEAALLPADGGYEVVGDTDVETELQAALSGAVADVVTSGNAEQQGVDLAQLTAGAAVEERLLDPDAENSDDEGAVAFAFSIIFLITALSFGMSIAQSVVQEKESRVVEILAAAVPVRQMLIGKIVGNTVLALAQIVLLVGVGALMLLLTGRDDLLAGVGPAAIWYVVLFVLGFLALASLWTVAGSLATSQEDLQSTTLPGQVLLFVPYFVGVSASDSVREIVSMLPIVSTMIMPGRIAEGEAPLWQVGVAVGSTVIAAVVLLRLGARLYERTLMQTSRKLSYREAFKLPAQ